MKKYLPLYIILIFCCFYSKAVPSEKDSLKKIIKTYKARAKRFDKEGDVYNAIHYYNSYLKLYNKDVKSAYRLASLYFLTRNYSSARQFYDTVITKKVSKFPMALYYKGIVCMNLQFYDEAVESFTKFRKAFHKFRDPNEYRKLAALYIESSEWAKNQQGQSDKISVTHLGASVNHKTIDFSPFPIDEQTFLYGALVQDSSQKENPVRKIYTAEKINGHWQTTGSLEKTINDPGFNTGNPVITEDGKRMYFTKTRKNWQEKDISEIYLSKNEDGVWQEPQKLPYPLNDENYTSTQPAIGKNLKSGNDILYFVSDRPGGKGGLDIWCSEYDSKMNQFKEPRVLDKGVNSIGNECCPFYDLSTGTLYFSSTGRNGLGGYDIYKSTGSGKRWTEATPLSKPINSSYDDYYFSILPNNREGFFTSNRPESFSLENGNCCDDIFYYKINDCQRIDAKGKVINSTNYDFYDHINKKYHLNLVYPEEKKVLADVPVELYVCDEKENEEILVSKTTTNQNGIYKFSLERNKEYSVLVKNYGYFEKRLNFSTQGLDCNDTLKISTTSLTYLPKINVRINIYYEHDKSRLTPEAKSTIDTTLLPLFELFPNAIIEIGSHTDNTGTAEYNVDLSQRRSQSVVNYLISKGILPERMIAKGYGLTEPIAPNTNPDGSDNPEGRQLNRRTEFKIVGEISSFGSEE